MMPGAAVSLRAGNGRGLVLFIDGLWLHPDSWLPWSEEFDRNGYDMAVFHWPAEPVTAATGRATPSAATGSDLSQLASHLAAVTGSFGRPAIVIGHGVGGLLAEPVLGSGLAAAAISLTPVPTGAAIASGARQVARRPADGPALYGHCGPVIPSRQQFHRCIANTATAAEVTTTIVYSRATGSGRPTSE